MSCLRTRRRTVFRFALCSLFVFPLVWWSIPDYRCDLNDFDAVVKIRDRHGRPLREIPDEVVCDPVPLEQMGEWTAQAVVAFEDKRFFRHGGIDPVAVCRAATHNVVRRRVVSGASTLTTLVVKLTQPRKRNLWTKLVEAHHARQLESHLSKDRILEQYLNRAPFGGNVCGIEAASQRYFGKPARNLSLAESAMLVGLPQSPSLLRPDRHMAKAVRQRNTVLARMLENRMISPRQYDAAMKQPMAIRRSALPFHAPHFCDYILRRYPGQSELDTTLDLRIQHLAERALQRRFEELSGFGVCGGAVVVIDVRTGELSAMVGSPDFWNVPASGQVNGAVARRSPGSTLKPFAYAAAMDQGLCTPATMMADIPMHFAGYTPQNYSLEYGGPVSMRRALVQSLNIPALKCVEQIGLGRFVGQLRQLGLSTIDEPAEHYGLGIVIGGGESTLLDLANAYACLARGGVWRPVRMLQSDPANGSRRIFSEESAYMVADVLGGEERSSELVGHMADAVLPRIGWKTGTSSGHRDAWAVAYNPEYVVGVWLGNPDGAGSDALVGGAAAAPVAGDIFRRLYPQGNSPWYDKPAGVKVRLVCACSGLPPSPDCPSTVPDYHIPRISPVATCGIHRNGREIWPAAIQAFLERRGMCATKTGSPVDDLSIVSPVDGETFRLIPSTPGIRQQIRFASAGWNHSTLYWFVDNVLLHVADAGQPVFWPLEKGSHFVACTDGNGHTARIRIVVE